MFGFIFDVLYNIFEIVGMIILWIVGLPIICLFLIILGIFFLLDYLIAIFYR